MAVQVFAASVGAVLRQGEIISAYAQYQLDVDGMRQGVVELIPIPHPYVVVLSQDCDLEQDYARRANGATDNLLASILFCAAAPADDDFRHGVGLNSNEWKKVRQNNDPRFHFIRAAAADVDAAAMGFPELVVDFKQHFAVPTLEAYYAIETARRRCRLVTPYVEHLSGRFTAQLSRVALPLDHHEPQPIEEEQPAPEIAAGPLLHGVAPAEPAIEIPAPVEAGPAVVAAPAPEGDAVPAVVEAEAAPAAVPDPPPNGAA